VTLKCTNSVNPSYCDMTGHEVYWLLTAEGYIIAKCLRGFRNFPNTSKA